MRSGAFERLRALLRLCATLPLLVCFASPPAAARDYEIDVRGALQTYKKGMFGRTKPVDEPDVSYRIVFRYREPDSVGFSAWDRSAQIDGDGRFEIAGLRGNRVYQVYVERIAFAAEGGGAPVVETVPLDVPPDFFLTTPVPADAPSAAVEVAVELPLTERDKVVADAPSLSFQYNGKEVRIAAIVLAPLT